MLELCYAVRLVSMGVVRQECFGTVAMLQNRKEILIELHEKNVTVEINYSRISDIQKKRKNRIVFDSSFLIFNNKYVHFTF